VGGGARMEGGDTGEQHNYVVLVCKLTRIFLM